jgi:SNF2 family DNA or RNA helicase
MLARSAMYEYQRRAASFARGHDRCALWLDLGLGKTCVVLTAISDLLDLFEIRNALVVAPLRVAQTVWTEEIAKWRHLRHLRASVMVGDQKQRIAAFNAPADLHVTNVDSLPWLENYLRQKNLKFPWDAIVIDEASMFKSRGTRRFKIMRRMAAEAKRVIEMTATPSPNSYIDIWPQFYILDGGQRLGPTMAGYRERYFKVVDFGGYKFALKRGADKVIQSRIKDITLTLAAADYLEMPERVNIYHRVEMDETERATYDRLEKDAVAKVAGQRIEAVSAAALATKLLQLANGQVYDETGVPHVFHGRKLERLHEIVDEAGEEPVLVAYAYKSDAARILRAFPQAVHLQKDPRVIQRWNRGEIPLMLAHPASAGHGLNLQYGGRTIVWYGLTWSLELYLQFVGRLHRQGQTKPVRNHHLVTSGTIDEDVLGVLTAKNASQSGLLAAMKRKFEIGVDPIQQFSDNAIVS